MPDQPIVLYPSLPRLQHGQHNPMNLMDYIGALEDAHGKEAIKDKELLPLKSGDMPDTYANVDDLVADFDYKPAMPVQEGVGRFVEWHREFYKL